MNRNYREPECDEREVWNYAIYHIDPHSSEMAGMALYRSRDMLQKLGIPIIGENYRRADYGCVKCAAADSLLDEIYHEVNYNLSRGYGGRKRITTSDVVVVRRPGSAVEQAYYCDSGGFVPIYGFQPPAAVPHAS